MLWYKHMCDMRNEVEVERLIYKFSIAGYGLYCVIKESVAQRLTASDPLPDLKETNSDLARKYGIPEEQVCQIVDFCVEQKLLTKDDGTGKILCPKIYENLDPSQTGNIELRKMIKKYKAISDGNTNIGDESGCSQESSEQKRLEQIRRDKIIETCQNLYEMYPGKCPFSQRRSLKSRAKDIKKIERLLREKSSQEIEVAITQYVDDCNKTKTYYKNFATFLNNIPDIDLEEKSVDPLKTLNAVDLQIIGWTKEKAESEGFTIV